MRLDPNRPLSPATVEAIEHLIGRPPVLEVVEVTESDLLQLALGVADPETRLACARAMVASPDVRAQLVRIQASVREGMQESDDQEEKSGVGRLCVFAGPFSLADAAAVFPEAFVQEGPIPRLLQRGWLVPGDETGTFVVPPAARVAPISVDASGADAGWAARFVEHYANRARVVDRTISEGRWNDGSAVLKRDLPNMRSAWNRASALGMLEAVASFAESLAGPLTELGAVSELTDLASVGYSAADTLVRADLRARLLSMEGVAASRAGNSERARFFWTQRLELCRSVGDQAREADAMLDLAGQAYDDKNFNEWRDRVEEAWPIAVASGRADLVATVWASRALEAKRVGDLDAAARYAERALELLSGEGGIDAGLFVQISAAQTLVKCGRLWSATDALTQILSLCIEGGRASHAALALREIGRVMEAFGRPQMTARCYAIELGIHRELGSLQIPMAESRLAKLRAAHPYLPSFEALGEPWEASASRILDEIFESRAATTER